MNPNQKIRIPIPTDSYDQISCDQATITSLKMLITAFDTTMDSFHESIDKLTSRLDVLSERTMKIQHRIVSSLDDGAIVTGEGDTAPAPALAAEVEEKEEGMKGEELKEESKEKKILKVSYPALYDHATQMNDVTSSLYRTSSAISMAKQKANDAIKSLLLEELNDDSDNVAEEDKSDEQQQRQQPIIHHDHHHHLHNAKPSDEWLDRASAFEERSNSKMAMQIHTVPPLILNENSVQMMESALLSNLKVNPYDRGDKNMDVEKKMLLEEAVYYKNGLEYIEDERYSEHRSNTNNNAVIFDASSMQQQQQHSTSANNSLTLDYYDDNMSVISDYTRGGAATTIGHGGMYGVGGGGESHTIVSSYSTVSHGTSSASRRRRQRKIMALAEATTSPSRRDRIIKDSQKQHQKQKRHTPNKNTTFTSSIAGSRQQALSGSIPYVCDLIHDSFGLIDGRFDHVYPTDETVNELLIDNNGIGKSELKMSVFSSDQEKEQHQVQQKDGSKAKAFMKGKTKVALNVLSEEESES